MIRAFAGAQIVFWLPPGGTDAESAEAAYVDFSCLACSAFRARGVRHTVDVSALGRGGRSRRATCMAYGALAYASLTENMLRQAASILATGEFAWPTPADVEARHATACDIAAIAARLLRDRSAPPRYR